MSIRRMLCTVTAAVVAAVVAAGAGAALVPPPTLTGEIFAGALDNPPDYFGSQSVTSASCDTSAGGGTFTYTATGTAVGPYPGTYTETGTVSLGPFGFGPGSPSALTSFDVSFTITPVPGDTSFTAVTGTKHLVAPFTPFGEGEGYCSVLGSYMAVADDMMAYSATITSTSGTFHDEGTNQSVGFEIDSSNDGSTWESFASSLAQTIPLAPTSKDQCKNGGYALFGFENQGQCVAYVERTLHS